MSRCFPYSPLRREEPLIESIKLKKERENAKKEKKEKRKDKKENKDTVNSQEKKHRHKKRKHKDISLFQQKDDGSTKTSNDAIDQLERSSLTEEHGTPIQNPEFSEGSPDSNKKRKLATSVDHSSNGATLRIKLHLPILQQKNMDLPPLPRGQQGKAEPGHENLGLPPLSRVEQEKAEAIGRMLKQEAHERHASSQQACYSGRIIETTPGKEEQKGHHRHGHRHRHRSSRSEHKASCSKEMKQFSELIMNWDALKLQCESTDTSNQDWLFGAPKRDGNTCTSKINKVGDDSTVPSSSASSSCQPRACYVPEFDMYQLPYVIPF